MIEETLRGLREKNDGLRKKINQQEFSPEEIDQIRNAAKMWRGKIEDISGQKQAVADRISALVAEVDKEASKIYELIARYHSDLTTLRLLPPTSELAKGVDYRLTLEHVEDASSATVRNVQQYERQIIQNGVLARLAVGVGDVCDG